MQNDNTQCAHVAPLSISDSQDEPHTECEEVNPVPDGFHITDSSSANWVIKKICEARAYANRVDAWAEAEKRKAENEERHLLQRFASELESWLRDELNARGNRTRYVALPAGRVSLRRCIDSLVIGDESLALSWAKENLVEALKLSVTVTGTSAIKLAQFLGEENGVALSPFQLLKSILNEHVRTTGEIPDGTELQLSRDVLLIR